MRYEQRTRTARWLGLVLATLLLALLPSAALAEPWSQWRGAGRDGWASDFETPERWPTELDQVWRSELGAGYASPVTDGELICVHSREGEEEIVSCLDVAQGEVRWSARYAAPFAKNSYALKHGEGPNATPLIDGGRLYTLGMSGIVSAFDLAGGALLWRHDHSARVSTKKLFCGTSASPLLMGELLIVQLGDDVEGGALIAYEAASGEERWRWEGLGPGYASPMLSEIGDSRQIVTLTADSIVGIDVAGGQLLWELDFEDEWNENIVSPILHGDVLIVAGVRRGTRAYRMALGEEGWSLDEVWNRPDLPQYMSSPVLDGEVLYGYSSRQKGQLFALDVTTGKTLWESEGRMGQNAALVAVGETHLAVLTTGAELVFVERSPEKLEITARYTVAEGATWAHPLFMGRKVAVKDGSGLTFWHLGEGEPPSEAPPAEGH